jgi:hypothetical protein
VLILDRSDPSDPRWLLCTVTAPGDVRPADPGGENLDEVTSRWATARCDHPEVPEEMPGTLAWRVG